MKNANFLGALAAPLLMFAFTLPSYADSANPTTCKDGTTSATTGRGACSGHGGVQKTAKGAAASADTAAPAAAAPAMAAPAAAKSMPSASKSAPAAAAGNMDATAATAKCKDGTYSKSKSHTGACSHHGGVSDWLDAAK